MQSSSQIITANKTSPSYSQAGSIPVAQPTALPNQSIEGKSCLMYKLELK